MADAGWCPWCCTPVMPPDRAFVYANGPVAHWVCAMRQVIGSVAHLERRCHCYVAGATAQDPDGLSRRDAAEAAVAVWMREHRDHA
jgi:hypothetical protein